MHQSSLRICLPWAFALAFCVAACGDDLQTVEPNYAPNAAAITPSTSGTPAASGESGSGDATSKPATGKGVKKEEHLPLPGIDEPAAGGAHGGATDLTAQDCGYDANQASADLLQEDLTAPSVVGTGVKRGATMTSGTLLVRSTPEVQVATLKHQVTGSPKVAVNAALKIAAAGDGTVTTEFVPLASRAQFLTTAKGWQGIVCTVHPATKISLATAAGQAVIQFDPPLPAAVSNAASLARYEAELKTDRQWTGLTATVISSTTPGLTVGQKFTGVAALKRIAPALSVPLDQAGAAVVAAGDTAYELDLDFGGPQMTRSLGLSPQTKYFVDATNHRFQALVLDALTPIVGQPSSAAAFLPSSGP